MILPLTNSLFKEIYNEYMKVDFPPDELKPCSRILKQKKAGIALTLGYYDGNQLVGYAVIEQDAAQQILLLDYFAILPQFRQQGKGTLFLSEIKNMFSNVKCIFIETEAPIHPTAIRRLEFYLHAGARKTTIQVNLFHVDYLILTLNNNCSDDENLILLKEIYDTIYPAFFRKNYLKYY